MSSDASILLRMLEPAVRPGALPGSSPSQAPPASFENQPFEQLLRDARLSTPQSVVPEEADSTQVSEKAAGPLAPLADLSRIENQDVRKLLSLPDRSQDPDR